MKFRVIVGAAAILASQPLLAEAPASSRFPERAAATPLDTTIISAEEIARSNATSLGELLALQAGVRLRDLSGLTGAMASADLGGFGAGANRNTLILLNGRRLGDADLGGASLATVALNAIERIEIVHGSAAVLHGDNATAGLINIITKNGFGHRGTGVSAGGGAFGSGRIELEHTLPMGGNPLYAAASARRSGGYRDHGGFDQQNISAELSHRDAEFDYGFRFHGAYETLELPGPLGTALYDSDPKAASASGGQGHQNRNTAQAYIHGSRYSSEITISDTRRTLEAEEGEGLADMSSWSMTPRFKREIAGHHLVYGLDIHFNALDTVARVRESADPATIETRTTTTTRNSQALYLSDSYRLGERSTLTAGVRRHWVDLDMESSSGASAKRDDGVSAWDLGLDQQFSATARGYLRWAGSFRLPLLDEMWDYRSGSATLLKPQRGRHLEAGGSTRLESGGTLGITLFQIILRNEIGFDGSQYLNFSEPARHRGATLALRHPISERWQANLGYGWRDAAFISGVNEGKTLPEIPRHTLTLANQIDLGSHGRLDANVIHSGKRRFGNDFANSAGEMPSYTVVNLAYSRTIAAWHASLRLDNIMDKKRADSGDYLSGDGERYYYPLPGRAWYLNLGTNF